MRPHLERGPWWSLCKGMCQQEYVIHADAQCQEGQHLEGHRGGQLQEPSSWSCGPPRLPYLVYLGCGGIEGNAEQGAEPKA